MITITRWKLTRSKTIERPTHVKYWFSGDQYGGFPKKWYKIALCDGLVPFELVWIHWRWKQPWTRNINVECLRVHVNGMQLLSHRYLLQQYHTVVNSITQAPIQCTYKIRHAQHVNLENVNNYAHQVEIIWFQQHTCIANAIVRASPQLSAY